MNLWECSHPGCQSTCVGVKSAVGLRAIGWYFELGPRLLCPRHRPDKIRGRKGCSYLSCSQCAAEKEAETIQATLWTPKERKDI